MSDLNGFRITKYDPALRDERGRFRAEDWTSFSDIGSVFGGRLLTEAEYERTEAAYLRAVRLFAECCGEQRFQVRGLEDHSELAAVREGQIVDLDLAVEVARDVLREKYWCRLETDAMQVHLGYDYYMYIEAARSCPESVAAIRADGLFVEQDFPSPYRPEE